MNNKECIEKRIDELKEVLEEIDRLDSVKEKLLKINNLKDLTEDVFSDQEDVFSVISDYVEKELDLQRLIIKGLNERIERVCEIVEPEKEIKVNLEEPEEPKEKEETIEEVAATEEIETDKKEEAAEPITNETEQEVVEDLNSAEKVADEVISDEMIDDMAEKLMKDIDEKK